MYSSYKYNRNVYIEKSRIEVKLITSKYVIAVYETELYLCPVPVSLK